MKPAALAFLLAAAAANAEPRLIEDSRVVWSEPVASFGSFSGLELSDNGTVFWAVADKGYFATGALERKNGRLTGLALTSHGQLLGTDGFPVSRYDIDAEGLARAEDGTFYVSFEANHRVWHYPTLDGSAEAITPFPDITNFQNNSSFEALAFDDGALLTLPERSGAWERPFPIYRHSQNTWTQPAAISREGRFLITGADIDADGNLWLLERHFYLLGFATRIRRFPPASDGFGPGTLMLQTPLGALDNMEGISVWTDTAGQTRVTLISDDNNSVFQSTLFVEYILADRTTAAN